MPSEWPYVRIGELVAAGDASLQTGPFGSQLHKHDYVERGVSIIPTEAIGRGAIRPDVTLPQVSEAKATELSRHKLRQGDILFARRGIQATGLSAVVGREHTGALCGTGAILLRVNHEVMDPSFLGAVLATDAAYEWLRAHAVGAVMPNLNSGIIGQLAVPRLGLTEQRVVASTSQALSQRTDLLRQTNATLESIAQALFKSWFIDFDPVHAKQAGREPEGMDAANAALFPAEFEESALGPIPKGWTHKSAGSLFDVGIGKTPPRKEPQWFKQASGDFAWLSIKDMGDEGTIASRSSEFLSAEAVTRFHVRIVPSHTVLMSFKLTVGRLTITDGAMTTNEAIAHFKARPDSPPFTFLYCHLKAFDFRKLGSTSSIADATNSKAVKAIPVLVPSPKLAAAFHRQVSVLFDKMFLQKAQWRALEELRDTLLPRLISGKLRLPEAQEQVEDALA